MARLKLFGEQEGGSTDDHSALSNLGYAQSGHTGFVPSQGEALIDILRLNQNLIRDSGGNDRITLATASPHVTLTGQAKITGETAVGGMNPMDYRLLWVQPGPSSPTTNYLYAIAGLATVRIPSGGMTGGVWGLSFQVGINQGGVGTILPQLQCLTLTPTMVNYTGTVTGLWGAQFLSPYILVGNPSVTTYYGIELQAVARNQIVDAYGLKIGDITLNTGFTRLLEVGPATPYLRVVGGANPPADKSNLYLKFGSTFYRVVKSGSYLALEAA